MEEKEIWKDVVGYEGLYQVSNNGRVRSVDRYVPAKNNSRKHIDGKLLTQHYDKDGYCFVHIRKPQTNGKNARVHRLVVLTFIPSVEGKDFIDHINGIRSDNRVDNLRWCTAKQNQNYELARSNKIHVHTKLKGKSILQFTTDGNFVKEWDSISSASIELGYTREGIRDCCRGKQNTVFGFIWKYNEDMA